MVQITIMFLLQIEVKKMTFGLPQVAFVNAIFPHSNFCQSRKKASELTYVGRPTDFQSTSSIHQFFLNRLHNHTSNPFWTIVFFLHYLRIFVDCTGFFLISFSAPHVWETQFAVCPDKNKCELPLEKGCFRLLGWNLQNQLNYHFSDNHQLKQQTL